jgi:charged multivesicular body protein 3
MLSYLQAGIMEEMMEDTLDSGVLGEDEDELEEEAQGEVDKVLFELTDGAYREPLCLLLRNR